jgi:hypothetical protein
MRITSTGLCLALVALLTASASADMGMHGMPFPKPKPPPVHPPHLLLAWGSMYGVDGPLLGEENAIRGVVGDEAPWVVARARGFLTTDGHLVISVRGLVFKDDPLSPPDEIGKNDEAQFRGLVSCLTEDGDSIVPANVVTGGFPATTTGDSLINARLQLPNPCIAPIVMVLAGSEDKMFAVTGFEAEGD